MSDAAVAFSTLHKMDAAPGEEQMFSYRCPRRGTRCEGLVITGTTTLPHDPGGKNGGIAQWSWDHNRAEPTFAPSIVCGVCDWHGFIEKGRCVNTAHVDEPERGGAA